jgi:sugar lactone lactonase YvrE
VSEIECVVMAGAGLGESPVWDDKYHLLYWVDISGKKLHRFDPYTKHDIAWDMPHEPGAVALCDGGGVTLAMRHGFYWFGFMDPNPTPVAALPDEPATNRLNDSRVDPAGRFWAGTVNEAGREPTGALYCLDAKHRIEKKIDAISCSNSLCWSPDGKIMYHADSFARIVHRWAFDAATGAIADRRVLIEVPPDAGIPDGAAVDSEGCLWIAHWGPGEVRRYDPEGKLMRAIKLPTTNVTCPCFGGRDLTTLYVTSATFRLSDQDRARQPLAGGLFALEAGVKGLPEKRYRG